MFSKQLLHTSIVRFCLIVVVLCSITLLGAQSLGKAKASVQSVSTQLSVQSVVSASAMMPNAPSGLRGIECNIATVGVDPDRIVTHCLPLDGAIGWYSLPTGSDPKFAARVLAILLTAKATNKLVSLVYYTDDATTCPDPNVCRKLFAVEAK